MSPVYADDWLTVLEGDCRAVLADLPAESVHAIITSPPYWGLRDYGIPASVWADRWRGALGLEADHRAYLRHLVEVAAACWRVLRRDGTLWLVLGDTYAAKGRGTDKGWDKSRLRNPGRIQKAQGATLRSRYRRGERHRGKAGGLKEKDRAMIPARAALALQAAGWHLRDEIIWAKSNPMPSSAEDRTTPSHETVYLLTKRSRYYFDAFAIREPDSGQDHDRRVLHGAPSLEPSGGIYSAHHGLRRAVNRNGSGRNRRSVWPVATQPFPSAHFATFPERLVEPMVLAGVPERVCPECAAPWARLVERDAMVVREGPGRAGLKVAAAGAATSRTAVTGTMLEPPAQRMVGWREGCAHGLEPIGGTVLDPFAGSGTVGLVAQRFGRRAILVDLNAEYLRLSVERAAREFGVGGRRLEDPGTALPLDGGLWAAADA